MINKKLSNKKFLKPQLTLEGEKAKLRNDKKSWEKEKGQILRNIDHHYQTHEGGGLYYRWFSEESFWVEQELAERQKQLEVRKNKEANRKQNGIIMGR